MAPTDPTPHHHDFTVDEFLDALRRSGLTPRQRGSEYHCSCPSCGGSKRFFVHAGHTRKAVAECRECHVTRNDLEILLGMKEPGTGAQFPGRPARDLTAGMAPVGAAEPAAELAGRPVPGPDDPQPETERITFVGPAGDMVQERIGSGPGKHCRFPTGSTPARFVWLSSAGPIPDGSDPIIVCEGAKDAAAAAALTGWPAAGTPSSSIRPEPDVLSWAGISRHTGPVILWADADPEGVTCMEALADTLSPRGLGATGGVLVLDPSKLPGAPDPLPKGWGAADWQPREELDVTEAILEAAAPPAVADLLDELGIVTLDRVGVVTAEPVARGLLFRRKLGVLHGGAGSGKTTVVAGAVAAITVGREWLGHPTAEGDVLVLGAEDEGTLHTRITEFSGDLSRVHIWPNVANLGDLPAVVERLNPVAVIVDSLTTVSSTLNRDLDNTGEASKLMRPIAAAMRASSAAWLVIHHEPWDQNRGGSEKTAGRPRNSTEIGAAADYLVTCRCDQEEGVTRIGPGFKVRHGIPIEHLAIQLEAGGFEIGGGGGNTPPGVDPFQVPADPDTAINTFAQGWLMQNPEAGRRAFRAAARAAGFRFRSIRLDSVLERVPSGETLPPGHAGHAPAAAPPVSCVSRSGTRSGHARDTPPDTRVPSVSHPIGDTLPGHVSGTRSTGHNSPVFNPGGAFMSPAEPLPIQEAKVQDEHTPAEWDAAIAAGTVVQVNPKAIIATGQFADRPQLRRELTRSEVAVTGWVLEEIPAPDEGWPMSEVERLANLAGGWTTLPSES